MITIDEFESIAQALADELPDAFFKELNNQIMIMEESKINSASLPNRPLYIMGEYYTNMTGRGIRLYYGSFAEVYPTADAETLTPSMRSVLRHEFRHHLEGLAGVHDLVDWDRDQLAAYLGTD